MIINYGRTIENENKLAGIYISKEILLQAMYAPGFYSIIMGATLCVEFYSKGTSVSFMLVITKQNISIFNVHISKSDMKFTFHCCYNL